MCVCVCVCVCASFPFEFGGKMWDSIVLVPDHCLSFTLKISTLKMLGTSNMLFIIKISSVQKYENKSILYVAKHIRLKIYTLKCDSMKK